MSQGYIFKKYNIHTDVVEIPNTTRIDMAQCFSELGFKTGVEVGVAAGEYSEAIMKLNPQLDCLFGVDPYTPYDGYRDYKRLGTFDKLETEAHQRLDKYDNYAFIRKTSMDAVKQFEDGSLDFVYIDGNHSEPYVSQDIEAWTPKVRKGGIVAGHDYARIRGSGGQDSSNWAVIQAVHKYADEHDKQLIIWGLEAKIPGMKRDASRSWSWVN